MLSSRNDKFVDLYESALEMYLQSNFKKAKTLFVRALKIKKGDLPSLIFVDRCKEYLKNSPEKIWDGSFEMKTK